MAWQLGRSGPGPQFLVGAHTHGQHHRTRRGPHFFAGGSVLKQAPLAGDLQLSRWPVCWGTCSRRFSTSHDILEVFLPAATRAAGVVNRGNLLPWLDRYFAVSRPGLPAPMTTTCWPDIRRPVSTSMADLGALEFGID